MADTHWQTEYLSPKLDLSLRERSWLWPRPYRLKLEVTRGVASQKNRAARFSFALHTINTILPYIAYFVAFFLAGNENELEKLRANWSSHLHDNIAITFIAYVMFITVLACKAYVSCRKSGSNGKSIPASIAVAAATNAWNCDCPQHVTLAVCLSHVQRQ